MSAPNFYGDVTETKKRAVVFGRKKNVEGYSENIELKLFSIINNGIVGEWCNKIFYNKKIVYNIFTSAGKILTIWWHVNC